MLFFDLNKLILRSFLVTWLTLAIVQFFEIPDTISAVFCALICVGPSILNNFKEALLQLTGVLLGVIIGYLNVRYFGTSPTSTAAAIAVTFYICHAMNWQNILVGAFFSVLYMNVLIQQNLEFTLLVRLQSVGIGIGVATVVNYLFSAFQHHRIYKSRFLQSLQLGVTRMVPVLEAMKQLQHTNLDTEIKSLAQYFDHLKGFYMDLEQYCSLNSVTNKLFGINHEELLKLKLIAAAWTNICRKVLDLAKQCSEESTKKILEQNQHEAFHHELQKLLNCYSVNISRCNIKGTGFEPLHFNYEMYQSEVYSSSEDGENQYVQSLYLHLYFDCIVIYRNLEILYRNKDSFLE